MHGNRGAARASRARACALAQWRSMRSARVSIALMVCAEQPELLVIPSANNREVTLVSGHNDYQDTRILEKLLGTDEALL
jgi:hypothetical protein